MDIIPERTISATYAPELIPKAIIPEVKEKNESALKFKKEYESINGEEVGNNKVRELSEHNQVFISELSAPDDFKMVWHKKIKNTVGLNNSLDQVEKLFIKK